jgi:hypothetical protein
MMKISNNISESTTEMEMEHSTTESSQISCLEVKTPVDKLHQVEEASKEPKTLQSMFSSSGTN